MASITFHKIGTHEPSTSYSHYTIDPPSAPGLTATPGADLLSFDFLIAPPTPPDCVSNYIITATSSNNVREITLSTFRASVSAIYNIDGFDVCTTAYSFTVFARTSDGGGRRSSTVRYTPGQLVVNINTSGGVGRREEAYRS